jgi:hypothetical protein
MKIRVYVMLIVIQFAAFSCSFLHHEGVLENGCIDPRIPDLGTSWRWVVSFIPRPLYPRGKSPRYPLDRRLGGPQNRSGRRGREKNRAHNGTRTPTPRPSNPQPVAIPTALTRLFFLLTYAEIKFTRKIYEIVRLHKCRNEDVRNNLNYEYYE